MNPAPFKLLFFLAKMLLIQKLLKVLVLLGPVMLHSVESKANVNTFLGFLQVWRLVELLLLNSFMTEVPII